MKRILTPVFLLAPSVALAHPGHGAGFAAGVLHPLSGTDHLLAMLAIGLWAAALGGRAVWALPAAFVLALAGGGLAGHLAGAGLPGIEAGIEAGVMASVLVLGVLLALAVRLPLPGAVAAVAGFGLLHGLAHGAEAPAAFAPFAAGFVLASLALHGAGLVLGRGLWLGRAMGVLTAGAGVALMLGA